MIQITDKHQCCGCEACAQICPKYCIRFEADDEGFLYPQVDKQECIGCGLCEKTCPVLHPHPSIVPLNVYAAKNKCEEELLASSSGGLFIAIAKKVIKDGGVIFGAKFDADWNVIHSYADTMEGVKAFMGSKYVQSRIGNTFSEAKDFLRAGRKVLFTGTSCQIAALKNFLQKDYDNLLTIDVICHGVPSPKVWQRYLDEIKRNALQGVKNSVPSPLIPNVSERDALSKGNEMDIKDISFRDKRISWEKFSLTFTLAKPSSEGKQNTVSLSHIFFEDAYMRLFLNDYTLRPCCYSCPTKSGRSHSDLTIADFWGIELNHPELADNEGVGLLIVNTLKGMDIIDKLLLEIHGVTMSEATVWNPSYYVSKPRPSKREKFFREFHKNNASLEQLANGFLRRTTCCKIVSFIKTKIHSVKKHLL